MRNWSIHAGGVLAVMLWLPCAAQQVQPAAGDKAQETTTELAKPGERSPVPTPAPVGTEQGTSGAFAAPLGEESLSRLRGGSDTPWSEMKLNGTVTGNSSVDVVSGNNSITGGSFANATGLPMVIQNTGSNVLIQNATIVNVQFK